MAAGQAPVRPDKSLVPTARCPKVEQNTLASCNRKLHTKGFQSKSTQVSLFNKVPRRSFGFRSPNPARREASSTVSTKHSSTISHKSIARHQAETSNHSASTVQAGPEPPARRWPGLSPACSTRKPPKPGTNLAFGAS